MKRLVLAALLMTGCAREFSVWRAPGVTVLERAGEQRVVAFGREHEKHAAVSIDAIVTRGHHVAYAARDGLAWRVYLDEVVQGGRYESIGSIALSPDGRTVAFTAENAGHSYVVTGGRTSPPYEAVGPIGFGPAGELVFFAKQADKWRAVSAGRPSAREWSSIRAVRFSPALAYVAYDGQSEWVVRGDEPTGPFEAVLETTDDGFVARRKASKGRVAMAFGAEVATGEIDRLTTARGHYAFVRALEDGDAFVVDGRTGRRCRSISSLSMSADGLHTGYACVMGRRSVDLVVDERTVGTFDWARAPVFGAQGQYAYVAGLGSGAFIRSTTRPEAAFDTVLEDSLVVSHDGASWAAIGGYASVRKLFVIVNGRPVEPFDLATWMGEKPTTVAEHVRAVLTERARSSP